MTLAPIHRAIFPDGYVPSAEGALHVGIKDTFDIAGLVTSCGSRALTAQEPARADADVVARLKSAGCTVAGHTGMHELAYGVTGLNSWCGTPCNPHYPELIPGGSSSGSAAAVAAGLVDFALGTDTGGSVRIPATCCGVVGLKPTFGRVSRAGVVYEKTSLDCVGPFARDVAGIEQAMAIMVADWTEHADIHPAKVAYISSGVDAGINALTRGAAAQAFGLEDRVMGELEIANDAGLSIIARETWLAVGYLVQSGLLGDDVRQRLRSASAVTDAAVTHAEHVRERFTKVVDELLGEYHAMAMPAMPCAVPTLREAADANAAIAITALVRPFNLSGHPAISLPVGQVEGRPVSLQLIGRKGEDEALCALARRVMIYDKEKDHGDST